MSESTDLLRPELQVELIIAVLLLDDLLLAHKTQVAFQGVVIHLSSSFEIFKGDAVAQMVELKEDSRLMRADLESVFLTSIRSAKFVSRQIPQPSELSSTVHERRTVSLTSDRPL